MVEFTFALVTANVISVYISSSSTINMLKCLGLRGKKAVLRFRRYIQPVEVLPPVRSDKGRHPRHGDLEGSFPNQL